MWDGSSKENAMMKKAFWKGLIFVFVFLFSSCNDLLKPTMDEPVKDYLEYWSSTCQVAEVRYNTPNVEIDGVPNVAVVEDANGVNLPIEIDMLCINPKQLKLLRKTSCFSLTYEGETNSIDGYEEIAFDNDTSLVRIKAILSDSNEGKTITLKGCLWPENRVDVPDDKLKTAYPELFYETTFIQNTPPDNPGSVDNPHDETLPGNMHYLSFEIPKQNFCRNQGSKYEVKYWRRDEPDNSLTYMGSKTLTLSDNKNTGTDRATVFKYYFDEQEENLYYEYTVQVIGPRGLNSEVLGTPLAPGVHQLMNPELTILKDFNGLEDEDHFECIEVASDNEVISFTASAANPDENFKVTVDGTEVTEGNYKVSGIGRHTIVATSSKDGARTVKLIKRIRIVKTPSIDPIDLGEDYNGEGQDTEGFKYIEVDNTSDKVSYSIKPKEEGTTVSGMIDNASFDETTEQKTGQLGINSHTLTGIIHKKYCKDVTFTTKVKIVQKLQAPSYWFSPNLTGTKSGNYEWIEVPDGTTAVTYKITAASGCTMVVKNSFDNSTTTVNTYTYTNNLASLSAASSRDYTLTITVTKPYQNDQTFYKYVKMVRKLQKPAFTYYKNSGHTVLASKDDNADTSEMIRQAYADNTYGIELKDYGETMYYVASLGTGESLTIEDQSHDDESLDSPEGTLALGYHRLRLLVSRDGYQTQEYEELVYVQGILEPVTIKYSATKSGSTAVWTTIPQSDSAQDLKFSYFTYDTMPFKVVPGNSGNTISVNLWLGNTNKDSYEGTNDYANNLDTSYTNYKVFVNQTRQYCKPSTQENRTFTVKIKPVTVVSGQASMNCRFGDAGSTNEMCGTVQLGKNGSWQDIRTFDEAEFKQYDWDPFNSTSKTFKLEDKTDYICYRSTGIYEKDVTNKDWCTNPSGSISLSTLKTLSSPYTFEIIPSSGGNQVWLRIDLTFYE